MGMTMRLQRFRYVYGWRIRYWWMDTQSGARAQLAVRHLAAAAVIIDALGLGSSVVAQRSVHAPQQSFFWFIILLVIMIGAAIASYAARPKSQAPSASPGDAPSTEDGQMVVHHFGECWIDDSFILAWKVVGTDKIKSKGGKK